MPPRKKKSVQKSSPTSAEILPPLNTDVISAICSWLPLEDVRNCRLVSRTWKIGATPILKKKSAIHLDCSFYKEEIARNAKFKREMTSFGRPLHHVDVDLNEFSMVDFKSKLYLDNLDFFTKYLSVQKLGITAQISSVWLSQFLESVLLNASPNLVAVELGLHVYSHLMKEEDPRTEFCDGKIFNTVKKLELPFSTANWSLGKVTVPQIFAAFPNIEELRVSADLLPVLFVEGGSSPRLLSKLWVTSGMSGSKCNALLNLTTPLKHLYVERAFNPSKDDEWEEDYVDDSDISTPLYQVLSKNRHTLEYLDLGLTPLEARSVWKFPSFPNLKRLNFMDGRSDKFHDFGVSFDNSTIINYSTTFPKLESLGFTPWVGHWTPCFQSFFPAKAAICESVTRLEISDEYEHDKLIDMFTERGGGKIDAKFGRILKLFPNADNLFVRELKSYLVKKGHIRE